MSKTCADCEFHKCTNICFHTKFGCDGYCTNSIIHRKCDRAICKLFEIDKYFTKEKK